MDLETFIRRLSPEQEKELTIEVVVQAHKLYVSTKGMLEVEEIDYSPRKLREDCILETQRNYKTFG